MAKLVQKLVALLLKTFLEGLRCPAALIFIPPKQSKTHILLCSSRQIQKWDWVKNEPQTLASIIPTALRLEDYGSGPQHPSVFNNFTEM